MSIHEQPAGKRGSLKWIQRLINGRQQLIDSQITASLRLARKRSVEWVSPISPHFTEYRDVDFLGVIRHPELEPQLRHFWPEHGPQWDALGVASDGTVIIAEAKAHIAEVFSTIGAQDPKSVAKIEAAFSKTQSDLGLHSAFPWTAPFYQYANRVAHLHFLHNICGIPTYLVFIHFLGDEEMDGPRRRREWNETDRKIRDYLGLSGSQIEKRILDVFVEVSDLD